MMFTDAFRNDAAAKVTGRAKYTDDYKLPDMLYAVPLHSQVASAIIKSIDYSEALKQKGVVAVYTAKDIPGKIKFGQIIKDCPTIINRRIRSAGDVIALVVAETREIALSALPLIKVELEEIPAVYNPEEAMQETSPLVNPILAVISVTIIKCEPVILNRVKKKQILLWNRNLILHA